MVSRESLRKLRAVSKCLDDIGYDLLVRDVESVITDILRDSCLNTSEDQRVLSPRLPENVTQLLKRAEYALKTGVEN